MVEKWKLALKEFLKDYEENDDVVGAMLCGSYAYGTYNDKSDINVYLVLKSSCNYSESGNAESNSYIINYHEKTKQDIERSMENQFSINMFDTIYMFAYGKIIYDLTGEVKELQDIALEYVDKPINTISSTILDLNNKSIWCDMQDLKVQLDENRLDFNKTYFTLLDKIYDAYAEYLSIPTLPKSKVYKLLTDEEYKEKWHVFKTPEKEFINLYLKCYELDKPNVMYKNMSLLVNYYYEKQGGFNIRTFKIRTEKERY